ncbi:hypothetical protein B7463_g10270, partial [Scytalidium lignicola]
MRISVGFTHVIFWVYLCLFGLALAKKKRDVSSVTEVKTEIVYASLTKPSPSSIWSRFSKLLNSRQSSDCGSGLLVCDVEDPTRKEAPWHRVSAPFPQCYDPNAYVCSDNFLCPIGTPKIPGQYACGPYETATAPPSSTENSGSPSSTVPSQPGSTGGGSCGRGTLLCMVQDPTRLEAPWHGVDAPFPQCYDPALYICAENFLCPICAPKISGQYACGPYISPCPKSPGSGTGTGTSTPSSTPSPSHVSSHVSSPSSTSTSISVGPPSSSSSTTTTFITSTTRSSRSTSSSTASILSFSSRSSQSFTGSESISTILPSTVTLPNGSQSTIPGSTETFPISSASQSGSVIVISPSVSTEPDGSITTIPGTTETLPPGPSGSGPSVTVIPPSVSTEPDGSLTTIPGTTETLGSQTQSSGTGPIISVIPPSVSTEPDGSLTTIPGTTETLQPQSSGTSPSVTTIPPSVSTEPDGSLTTIPGTTETLLPGSSQSSIVTTIPPSVSTEPDGSLTTISGTTETLPLSSPQSAPQSAPQSSGPGGIVIGGSTINFPTSSEVLTEPNGETITLGPSGIVIGSDTITFPRITAPTTITSDGLTFTLEPGGNGAPSSAPASSPTSEIVLDGTTYTIGTGSQTITEPDGSAIIIGPSGIVIGTDTVPFPSPGSTLTTDGVTLGDVSATPAASLSTENPPTSTGPLPVFSTWPPDISVSAETTGPVTTGTATTGTHIYVTTTSSGSQGSGAPFLAWVPHLPCLICGCWFCPPGSSGFDLFGFTLPGIYPPPPPGIRPPGFSSDFPSITIGYDGNPTYSSEPESDRQTSTSTSASSSSCSTVTATDCTDFVSYGVNTAGSTTTTATSSVCSTVTACSASDFTTTTFTTASCTVSSACSTVTSCPSMLGRKVKKQACATSTACSPAATACPGSTAQYIIYPASQDVVDSISNTLSNDFGIDSSLILTAQSENLGFNYWEVPLTQAQYTTLQGNSQVGAVYPVCTSNCYDPSDDASTLADSENESYPNRRRDLQNLTDTNTMIYSMLQKRNQGLVRQPGALDELVHISLGPNLQLAMQSGNYVYDKTGGTGSTVYIIDTGANLANPEFPDPALGREFKQPRWIFAGTNPSNFEEDTGITNNPNGQGVIPVGNSAGHGTAMLSKVAGDTLGVAKSTNTVIVVCPATVKAECYQDAVTKVYDDIRRNTVTNAVLLMSIYFDPHAPGVTDVWINAVRMGLTNIANTGTVIVTGSGNGKLDTIRGYPASFALKTLPANERVPSLIVAAGTDPYGTIATMFSGAIVLPNTDPEIDLVWAPGYGITVADARYNLNLPDGTKAGSTRLGYGTSEAAATVAGLCAYFLGLSDIGDQIRPGPNPIDNAMAMNAYLQRESFQRLGLANVGTVWNGVTISEEANNPDICPARANHKRQSPGPDYATCSPSSIPPTSTPSSSPSSSPPSSSSSSTPVTISATPTMPSSGPTSTPPLPTLSSVITPSGSTCVSTDTITSCAIGPGNAGTVCVTQTSCADWEPTSAPVTTTTSSAPTTIATPLAVGVKKCFPESMFPGHGDIDPDFQANYVGFSCADSANENMVPNSEPIIFHTITNGTPYYFAIYWITGCTTTVDQQNVWQPIGDSGDNADVTCISLLQGDYSNCLTNHGVGGWAEAGCLRYVFEPCDPSQTSCGSVPS